MTFPSRNIISRPTVCIIIAAALTVFLLALNVLTGSVDIAPSEVWAALSGGPCSADIAYIVRGSRLPSAVTALLAGASLAAAGLLLQTLFANPLADPAILGINSGAGLGVAVAVLLMGGGMSAAGVTLTGFTLTVAAALVGAVTILLLLSVFAAILRSNIMLLITGIMTGYLVSAVIELLSATASAEGVHSFIFWGMGSFAGVGQAALLPFSHCSIAFLLLAFLMVKPLNALLLGPAYAANLGVNLRRTRLLLLLITGGLSAIPTALCGPVAFIGLAVPHMARFASATADHRTLLPLTMLIGAITALASNAVCAAPRWGVMLPLNVVTSLWGVPVILYVIFSSRHRGRL